MRHDSIIAEFREQIISIIAKLDNGSHSSNQLQGADEEIVEVFSKALTQAEARGYERAKEELNDCSCKEKWTFNVVHRKDKPCYVAPHAPSDI